jgi:hypothetical protein
MKPNELDSKQLWRVRKAISFWWFSKTQSLKDLIVLLIAIAEEYDTGKG